MNSLSIDIGTSVLKAALISSENGVLSYIDISYSDYFDVDFENFDFNIWLFSFKKAISNFQPSKIDCISVSGISPCLIALNSNLIPLEVLHWNSLKIKPDFRGRSVFLPYVLSTVEKGTYSKISYFVSCFEYFIYLLTGKLFTSLPSIEYIPFIWDDLEIKKYGLDKNKFPPFIKMGENVGVVTNKAGVEFGLNSGISVVNAGSDYLSVLVGSGAFQEGIVSDRMGTSEGFNFVSSAYLPGFFLQYPYFLEGYFLIGRIVPFGYLIQLLKDSFYKKSLTFELLLKKIIKSATLNNVYFYPSKIKLFNDLFILDPYLCKDLSKGIFGSIKNPLEIGLAIIEFVCFAFYNRLLELKAYKKEILSIFVSGSNSDNLLLNQIKANILGKDLKIFDFKHSEIIGGAIQAFYALREFDSLNDSFLKLIKIKHIVSPIIEAHEEYLEKYQKYINNYSLFVNG
ncbi:FGGY-family carbohydrate kinase [Borreliella lusitaniae]|uniref:FGGY-family carbohydrate kinase n=1 Tax=Borreliella lusitaniae TaxID=100177 RepID=UPI0029318CFE|nr:FGGY-family carbohydrate kinase [Borreliella lusitaniae]WNY66886.1 FGGY-family carbohydrate kinase [Borreliella lusitaniae]